MCSARVTHSEPALFHFQLWWELGERVSRMKDRERTSSAVLICGSMGVGFGFAATGAASPSAAAAAGGVAADTGCLAFIRSSCIVRILIRWSCILSILSIVSKSVSLFPSSASPPKSAGEQRTQPAESSTNSQSRPILYPKSLINPSTHTETHILPVSLTPPSSSPSPSPSTFPYSSPVYQNSDTLHSSTLSNSSQDEGSTPTYR